MLASTARVGRSNAPRRILTSALPRGPAATRQIASNSRSLARRQFQQNHGALLQPLQRQQRQIHFLPLLGLWGAKHASAWTFYNACKAYGWPRVYRRLLEQNRLLNAANPSLQQSTHKLIRMAIEAPPKFAATVGQHAETVTRFLTRVAERAEPHLPRFMVVAIKFVLNSQKPIKILQDFVGAAAKK